MENKNNNDLKAFISECAKETVNEGFAKQAVKTAGRVARRGAKNTAKTVRRGAKNTAKTAGKVAKGADDALKQAANIGKKAERIGAKVRNVRSAMKADKKILEQTSKNIDELTKQLKNGGKLSEKEARKLGRTIDAEIKRYQSTVAKISKREKELAKYAKQSKAASEELKGLQAMKGEATANLKAAAAAGGKLNKLGKVAKIGALVAIPVGLIALSNSNSADPEQLVNNNDPNADPTGNGGGEAGGAGGAGGSTTAQSDERVRKMQQALNEAGYTDYEGKQLELDGILGPRTKSAAKMAGIDPNTWNGEPPIKPANSNNNATTQETFETNKAYGRFLGGADKAEIFAFQKKFGVNPTGVYDEATAEKAYELALDAQSEFTQAGRTIKAWYDKYGSYASGDQAGYERANSENQQQQLAQNVQNTLNSLNAALDAYMKNNPAANQRITYIKNQIAKADFEDAKAKANVLAQIGKRKQILQLIGAYEQAYNAQQASKQQAVNEIKTNFFGMLGRINNATILQ